MTDSALPSGDVAFAGLERDYEAARPAYPEAALARLRERVPRPEPPRILDVGCGTGKLTRRLAGLYPDHAVEGSDANPAMIEEARRATGGTGLRFRVATAEALPVGDGALGLLTAAQAVQRFDRPRLHGEAVRALAPGASLALPENNRDWRRSAFLEAYEALPKDTAPGHSRHHRAHDYAGELAAHDFVAVETETVPWVRRMTAEEFRRMARSSTRFRAALRAQGRRRRGASTRCWPDTSPAPPRSRSPTPRSRSTPSRHAADRAGRERVGPRGTVRAPRPRCGRASRAHRLSPPSCRAGSRTHPRAEPPAHPRVGHAPPRSAPRPVQALDRPGGVARRGPLRRSADFTTARFVAGRSRRRRRSSAPRRRCWPSSSRAPGPR